MLNPTETKPGTKIFWTPLDQRTQRRVAYRGVLLSMSDSRARIAILKRDTTGDVRRVERCVDPFWLSHRDDERKHDVLLTNY
jgi:hypothetical protein